MCCLFSVSSYRLCNLSITLNSPMMRSRNRRQRRTMQPLNRNEVRKPSVHPAGILARSPMFPFSNNHQHPSLLRMLLSVQLKTTAQHQLEPIIISYLPLNHLMIPFGAFNVYAKSERIYEPNTMTNQHRLVASSTLHRSLLSLSFSHPSNRNRSPMPTPWTTPNRSRIIVPVLNRNFSITSIVRHRTIRIRCHRHHRRSKLRSTRVRPGPLVRMASRVTRYSPVNR